MSLIDSGPLDLTADYDLDLVKLTSFKHADIIF